MTVANARFSGVSEGCPEEGFLEGVALKNHKIAVTLSISYSYIEKDDLSFVLPTPQAPSHPIETRLVAFKRGFLPFPERAATPILQTRFCQRPKLRQIEGY